MMLKHAAVVAVATASALASVQGLIAVAGPRIALAQTPAVSAEAPKMPDGHYWAQASANGRPLRLLVDTGASAVALTPADARRLGIDTERLAYVRPVITANGRGRAASVTLDDLSVGAVRLQHVKALVVREGLASSLLGMSYLGRLSRFEATRTALILDP